MAREFPEINRQFDEAFERLQAKAPLINGAYGTSPLAADHFLLKKSWDYFKGRIKTIEEQWRKMLEAKDAQLRTVVGELVESRKQMVDIEEENRMLRSLDQNVKKARTEDYITFARKNETLRYRWDAEREALQRKGDALEFQLTKSKKEFDGKLRSFKIKEQSSAESIVMLQKELAAQIERDRETQKRCSDELNLKDEKIQMLDTKVELLRGELDRRDQLVKQLKSTINEQEKDVTAMTAYVAELQRALREKDTEIMHQNTRYDILNKEKENLRITYEQERAEWRELWDRGRSLWDKKAS
jgi:chromosome segregation ATPase